VLGWGLVLGVITIVGLPPMGIFMSEFLILTSTFARAPALAIALALGLLVALGALLYRLNGLAFGEAHGNSAPSQASYIPMFMHLGLVLAAGIFLPPALVAWFQHVAELLR
jgi:hydrogenase-4 component F